MNTKYLCRVVSNPTVGPPTPEEMQRICATDSRHHGQDLSIERYQAWDNHLTTKLGFKSMWLVAREEGRLLAHIWFVTKGETATAMNVMACAYAATKLQVAAMLLEAEVILSGLGMTSAWYLDSDDHDYGEAFDVLGYQKVFGTEKAHRDCFVLPRTATGKQAVLRWRTISDTDDRRAELCLDRNWNTPSSLRPAALPGSSSTP